MQTEATREVLPGCRSSRAAAIGVALALLLAAGSALSQAPPPSAPKEQARVPTSYANVHKGPGSGQVVLVLVPRATVLPIIGRRGEWVQVRLSPELRKTSMLMRWYENEDSGWMHDSTVEITKVKEP